MSTFIRYIIVIIIAIYLIIAVGNSDWPQAIFWLLVFFTIIPINRGNDGK